MEIFIRLLLAHLLGDFLFQPTKWVNHKEQYTYRSAYFYLHLLVHFLLMWILLWDINAWKIAIIVTFSHGAIDLCKLLSQKEQNRRSWFFIDQFLHIISISAIWFVFAGPEIDYVSLFNLRTFVIITSTYFITFPTAFIIKIFALPWTKELNEHLPGETSLANAGKYIGILERLLIFIFILYGQWSGVGFLFTAKSVFRFGDLRNAQDRKLTEYILIGTLLSFGIAITVALFCRQ